MRVKHIADSISSFNNKMCHKHIFMVKHHPFVGYLPTPKAFRCCFHSRFSHVDKHLFAIFISFGLCSVHFFLKPSGPVVIDSQTVFNIQTTSIFRLKCVSCKGKRRSIDRYMQNYNKDGIIFGICWIAHSKVALGPQSKGRPTEYRVISHTWITLFL